MENPTIPLQSIIDVINTISPFSYAEEWDNVGLLVGDPGMQITGVFLGLDPTSQLLDEAIQTGANLVITHHPAIFKPLKNIRTDTPTGAFIAKAITRKIAIVGCHTNLDVVKSGVSEVLAEKLGAKNLTTLIPTAGPDHPEIGFGQVGELDTSLSSDKFLEILCRTLQVPAVKVAGSIPESISTIAVCGGSGSDIAERAFAADAQIYITGEVKHSTARWAEESGFCIVDAGHFATENLITDTFASVLKKGLESSGIKIAVHAAREQENPFSYYIAELNKNIN